MKIIKRDLSKILKKVVPAFPALILTGPRRSGKTFLLQKTFPNAFYSLLEDPDLLARIKDDPKSWLDSLPLPTIIDEIQNAPELFSYIRSRIDLQKKKTLQWILTGSQNFSLMEGVSESMAGRAAILELLPFSYRELKSINLLRGSFPEVWKNPSTSSLWFKSYIQTYLERDIRSLKNIKDLSTFRRFIGILASRNGQILNKTDCAAPLGISIHTVTEWLSLLETTGQIFLVPPYYENFGKRLTKSPKIYWVDTGLLCHLLGIETQDQLSKSSFVGSIFEAYVASEIIKNQINQGQAPSLYFFRDEQGLEVDFLIPGPSRLTLIECKYSKTIHPQMVVPMRRLATAIKNKNPDIEMVSFLVLKSKEVKEKMHDIRLVSIEDFLMNDP